MAPTPVTILRTCRRCHTSILNVPVHALRHVHNACQLICISFYTRQLHTHHTNKCHLPLQQKYSVWLQRHCIRSPNSTSLRCIRMYLAYAEVFCVAPTPFHPIPQRNIFGMHPVHALDPTIFLLRFSRTSHNSNDTTQLSSLCGSNANRNFISPTS